MNKFKFPLCPKSSQWKWLKGQPVLPPKGCARGRASGQRNRWRGRGTDFQAVETIGDKVQSGPNLAGRAEER